MTGTTIALSFTGRAVTAVIWFGRNILLSCPGSNEPSCLHVKPACYPNGNYWCSLTVGAWFQIDRSLFRLNQDCSSTSQPAPHLHVVIPAHHSDGATCVNGLTGIDGSTDNGNACCPLGCNQCGGTGCARNGDEGFGRDECCVNTILEEKPACSSFVAAPCVVVTDGEVKNTFITENWV